MFDVEQKWQEIIIFLLEQNYNAPLINSKFILTLLFSSSLDHVLYALPQMFPIIKMVIDCWAWLVMLILLQLYCFKWIFIYILFLQNCLMNIERNSIYKFYKRMKELRVEQLLIWMH